MPIIDAVHLREINMPLAFPFETSFGLTTTRRILLVEIESGGLTAWGECVAGEHPYFSDECIDTAWIVTETELAPRLVGKELARRRELSGALPPGARAPHGQGGAGERGVGAGGAEEARAAGEAAGRHAQRDSVRRLDWNSTVARSADGEDREELEAGYRRIKLKCKPGWDTKIFEAVRARWPEILLSCDANSAYRIADFDHIAEWDQFGLLMIEQPLWYDDFYFHSMLQKRLTTAICLDESIRNRRDALAAIAMESCRIINIKVGRVGGFSEAIAVHNAAAERGIPVWCGGMLETGIGRAHNIALSSLENFSLPGDVSASARYWAEDIIEPEVTVNARGEIEVPRGIGCGFTVLRDRIEALTVRRRTLRASARVTA